MKKKLPKLQKSSGNVFADGGMENADEHLLKAKLVSRIQDRIDERKLSQKQAAKLMGIAQPDLSNILHGRFRGYSVERLMRGLASLGCELEIVVRTRGRIAAKIPAFAAG